ncbi:MAG: PilT/PilU family type 4a pilus ATPase [Polyangiaceae bacterium]|nr:PilT/PilU family type 4a pilus ATPase [Polyangiaceae bacterium]
MATIDALFDLLLQRKGSDLHIGVGRPPMVRIRGELVAARHAESTEGEVASLLFPLIGPEQKRKLEEELDLDFAHAYGEKARFRASYFKKSSGYGAVFRVVPSRVATLTDLGCPAALRAISERRAGLVLVTGPTGSGKSTTLAAMLNHINETRPCHILTIEDPIEFVHKPNRARFTQREVGRHVPDFATAMKSAGREDADVILVGELRGAETIALALRLSSFGVLVFGTVHTNSAPATIDRIVNAFSSDEQPMVRGLLAESLIAVVAQELLPTADGAGRVAAQEILLGSSALSTMIRDGKTYQIASLMQGGRNQGMQTLDMALVELVDKRKITADVALSRARDREFLSRALRSS